jgi:SHS2 domain-containing protein
VNEAPFEEVEHTADWALRARGGDLASLMVNAARGMLSLMQVVPAPGPRRWTSLTLQAGDPAALLVRWLEELLFRVETRGVAFTDFHVALPDSQTLQATVEETGIASMGRGIKAVTYHGLQVESTPAGVQATIVFDV